MAMIKQKQVFGLVDDLSFIDGSIDSLEIVVTGKLDAAALSDLEASVNSLEGITSTNANDITSLEGSVNSLEGITTTNANDITSLEGSVTSLEGVTSTNANDITSLEGSVNSLEGITSTNAGNISTNANDITSLEGSVTSLEGVTSTNANDITSLEGSVNSLEGITTTNANDITSLEGSVNSLETITTGLIAREDYGGDDNTVGAPVPKGNDFAVTFLGFLPHPYDYEVYVNGLRVSQGEITQEYDGSEVILNLPYDVDTTDVFTIKAINI